MRLLLDTHVLIWALNDDPQLSDTFRDMINNENNTVYYSSASIWESAIKHRKIPSRMPYSGSEFHDLCESADYIELSINSFHTAAIEELKVKAGEYTNNDPFDQILIAQAKIDGKTYSLFGFDTGLDAEELLQMALEIQ